MRKVNRLPLVSLVLFLLLLASSPVLAKNPPQWVKAMGHTSDYSPAKYLVGYGDSTNGSTDAENLESAKDAARADIAKQVRVNVQSMTFQKQQDASGKVDSFFQTMSKSTADLRLDGIRIEKTWCAKKRNRCCALAVLDKGETAKRLRTEIRTLNGQVKALMAKAASESVADPARAVEDLLTARSKLNLALSQTGTLLAVGGTAADLSPDTETTQIDERIQKLLAGSRKDMDLAVTLLAYEITRAIDPKLRIMVDQFTMEPGKYSGSLAWFLSEGTQDRLVRSCGVKVVDRTRLTGNAARAAAYTDMDPTAPEARARVVNADAVLYGTYRVAGEKVYITAYLTDLDKGDRLASARIEVEKSALRSKGLTLAPKNVTKEMLEPPKVETPELKVKLWTDRGDGGVYRQGELMYVYLQANHDCYVRLIYTQADGTNIQIFPNAHDKDNKIRKGKTYVIPDKGDKFEFEVTGPFGAEVLQVFASTEPLPALPGEETADGLLVLDGSREAVVNTTRGLRVKKRGALYSESKCVVSTLPVEK